MRDQKENTTLQKTPNKAAVVSATEPPVAAPENKNEEAVPLVGNDYLDSSFIGKTTTEIAAYHLHTCMGGMIVTGDKKEKYAVAAYTSTIKQCQKGKNKIVLEKLINHDAQGKAHFEIKDELNLTSNYPKKCYSTVMLQLPQDGEERSYLIAYEDNNEPVLKNVHQIWEINAATGKFIKMKVPENFSCNNPGYADGL
ncbi:hypothetical protein U0035_22060 [Niabella yanshanensis]|uniref:Uncharacterized protein n=1 Tax=Niabella yanshanensis TaxID=577386 RepID=A0ABZ0W557_9BACT|nr:hypothetical protein [Niabella yanshanensis]WQD38362.1 hypothetical protein U0035_22060 [Niabella yanshanensis]